MVTVTPGSTPDETSDTVPSMEPFAACDCANAETLSRTISNVPVDARRVRIYESSNYGAKQAVRRVYTAKIAAFSAAPCADAVDRFLVVGFVLRNDRGVAIPLMGDVLGG